MNQKKELYTPKIKSAEYKTSSELTSEDLALIEMDRKNTGIYGCSNEYYYNNILYSNYLY